MARNLQTLVGRHKEALSKFPESVLYKTLETSLSKEGMSLREFDDAITRICGGSSPPFPFPSARDYYIAGSSHNLLGDIRVPFLALSAADDPVSSNVPVGVSDNGLVVLAVTNCGGHLGWFEAVKGFHVQRWMKKPVIEWIRAVGEDLVGGDADNCGNSKSSGSLVSGNHSSLDAHAVQHRNSSESAVLDGI